MKQICHNCGKCVDLVLDAFDKSTCVCPLCGARFVRPVKRPKRVKHDMKAEEPTLSFKKSAKDKKEKVVDLVFDVVDDTERSSKNELPEMKDE